eukprot:1148670-Pelagomonas_calceolata.AAC.3
MKTCISAIILQAYLATDVMSGSFVAPLNQHEDVLPEGESQSSDKLFLEEVLQKLNAFVSSNGRKYWDKCLSAWLHRIMECQGETVVSSSCLFVKRLHPRMQHASLRVTRLAGFAGHRRAC